MKNDEPGIAFGDTEDASTSRKRRSFEAGDGISNTIGGPNDSDFETSSSGESSSSLEISSSSESSSDSNIESDSDIELLLTFLKPPFRKRMCIRNYLEDIVASYNEEEFKKQFRISQELFARLSQQLENSAEYQLMHRKNHILNTAQKHMAVFLWFAGHEKCSFRDIAHRFDVSLSTVCLMVQRVLHFISELSPQIITWPDAQKKTSAATFFGNKGQFSAAIGAIDVTRIVIDPPTNGKDDYIDRDGKVSICLQAICDEQKKFIDIFVGYPGSEHDSRVLANSTIGPKLESLCGDYCILGDSAYKCRKYLLTPYKDTGHLTAEQKLFNTQLRSNRMHIEHAFSMLKQRFPQLYYCKLQGLKKLCHFIRACCVLHNLGNENDLNFRDIAIEKNDDDSSDTSSDEEEDSALGKALRDVICNEIAQTDIN